MRLCLYVCTSVCLYVCMSAYLHVLSVCLYVQMYACAHTYTLLRICAYVMSWTSSGVAQSTHIHTHTQIYTHTHTHTNAHTHTRTHGHTRAHYALKVLVFVLPPRQRPPAEFLVLIDENTFNLQPVLQSTVNMPERAPPPQKPQHFVLEGEGSTMFLLFVTNVRERQ